MPDWHDFHMPKVEVGELGRPGIRTQRGVTRYVITSLPALNSPSLGWPNSLPPHHTSLACFISSLTDHKAIDNIRAMRYG